MRQHLRSPVVVAFLFGVSLVAQEPAPLLPGLTDALVHVPSLSGPYGYNSYKGPALGQTFVDPDLGGTIRRITNDRQPDDIYARNMNFNADGTKYKHGGKIVDTTTGAVTHTVNRGAPWDGDSGFDAVDPNVYYYLINSGLRKVVLNANGTTTESPFYTCPSGSQNGLGTSVNWMDAQGELFIASCGGVTRVIDKLSGQAYSGSAATYAGGGWIGIAPSGNHIVGYWGDQGRSWKINKAEKTVGPQVIFWDGMCGDHGVPMTGTDGIDYALVATCNDKDELWRAQVDNNAAGKSYDAQRALPGNFRVTNLAPWQNEKHFSSVARGPLRDWAFVSMECGSCNGNADTFNAVPTAGNWDVLKAEIVAVNTRTGEMKRPARHRARSIPEQYGYQVRVSSSWDGALVGWSSNFNTPGGADIYVLAFGQGSGGGGGGGTTPVDCVVSSWSAWGPNPVDPTTEIRTRSVVTPPANGGAACGPLVETRPIAPPTPVDCVLSAWSAWGPWTPIPGTQTEGRSRTRAVITPPANGGAPCGALVDSETRPIVVVPPDPPVPPTGTLPNGSVTLVANPYAPDKPLAPGQGFQIRGAGTYTITLAANGHTYAWRVTGTTARVMIDGVQQASYAGLGTGTVIRLEWRNGSINYRRDTSTVRSVASVGGPVTLTVTGSISGSVSQR